MENDLIKKSVVDIYSIELQPSTMENLLSEFEFIEFRVLL